ncbi:hypothetical protein CLV77_2781 [Brevirhabdus pacifica]|uniref:hypothetical protein n=1 Tax=Brevirhabdus pacifica TaxID=1267768 RepID=UPI000CB77FF9|nr:hypothetical protein [Brevirhabdus pacifica]PJJ83003.1 hypothetical protein CLV77_2781 [Brevirhabdus pacifica]
MEGERLNIQYPPTIQDDARDPGTVPILRRYFAVLIPAHLLWEFAHMPLYQLWYEDTWQQIAFAGLHCTGGDVLIAGSVLLAALVSVGRGWPRDPAAWRRVAMLTVILGLGYTIFSEWMNTELREAWAYAPAMPVLPLIGTGLTPFLQWIVIPVAALWWAGRARNPDSLDER